MGYLDKIESIMKIEKQHIGKEHTCIAEYHEVIKLSNARINEGEESKVNGIDQVLKFSQNKER